MHFDDLIARHHVSQILHRHRQIRAAVHLVAWLKQRFGIRMRNVIGHAMANDSPYFKDLEGWRNDHTDWLQRDVVAFRRRLRTLLTRRGCYGGSSRPGVSRRNRAQRSQSLHTASSAFAAPVSGGHSCLQE